MIASVYFSVNRLFVCLFVFGSLSANVCIPYYSIPQLYLIVAVVVSSCLLINWFFLSPSLTMCFVSVCVFSRLLLSVGGEK